LCGALGVAHAQEPATENAGDSVMLRQEVSVAASYAMGRAFTGMRGDFAAGRDFASGVTVDGRLGMELGATQSRLPYQRISWGVGIGGRVSSRVRLGVEQRTNVLFIDRATLPGPDHAMMTMSVGLHGEAIVALSGSFRRGPHQPRATSVDLVVRVGPDLLLDVGPPVIATLATQLGIAGQF
jgi:hypothetical protein